MRKKCVWGYGAIIFVALLINGCKAPIPTYAPEFRPAPGDKRVLTFTASAIFDFDIMGQHASSSFSNTREWRCEVTAVDDEGAAITVTFGDVKINLDSSTQAALAFMPGQGLDLATIEKIQKAVSGYQFTLKLSPSGELLSIQGLFELPDEIVKKLQLPYGEKRNAAKLLLESSFGREAIQKEVKNWMEQYSNAPVQAGGTWAKNNEEYVPPFLISYDTTFTLAELGDSQVKLLSASTVRTGSGGSLDLGSGLQARFTLSGSDQGSGTLDRNTGWVEKFYSTGRLNGDMTLPNMPQLPAGISMKINIEATAGMESKPF